MPTQQLKLLDRVNKIKTNNCGNLPKRLARYSWPKAQGKHTNFFNHLLAYRNESCQHIIRKVKEGIHTEYRNNEQPTTNNSSTSDIPVNHEPISPCLVIKMPVPTCKRSNQGSKGNAICELFSVEKLQTSGLFSVFVGFFWPKLFKSCRYQAKNG